MMVSFVCDLFCFSSGAVPRGHLFAATEQLGRERSAPRQLPHPFPLSSPPPPPPVPRLPRVTTPVCLFACCLASVWFCSRIRKRATRASRCRGPSLSRPFPSISSPWPHQRPPPSPVPAAHPSTAPRFLTRLVFGLFWRMTPLHARRPNRDLAACLVARRPRLSNPHLTRPSPCAAPDHVKRRTASSRACLLVPLMAQSGKGFDDQTHGGAHARPFA